MSDTIRFYDPHTPPFSIHGLADPMAPMFRRVPADVAEATNDGVAGLALHTSGVRLRFTTESAAECAAILRGHMDGSSQPPQNMTRGLFYRGVE